MRFGISKDFCLWLVPAQNNGKVRKFRFGIRFLIFIASAVAVMLGSFIFVTGDYGRVQALRLKHYFALERAKAQRDELQKKNNNLENELASLKNVNLSTIHRERQVKQRLAELASILKGSTLIGAEHDVAKRTKVDSEGVGGMELDCGFFGCKDKATQAIERVDISSSVPDLYPFGEQMIEDLDAYIGTLTRLPIRTPALGHINSGFGIRVSPFSRTLKKHQGIDFGMSFGSDVKNTADGVVKAVKSTYTYGLLVDISHGQDVVTRYAHLSQSFVGVGERVCAGEVIGLTGSSGRSTGPHLHYEVRVRGKAVDPMIFLGLGEKLVRAVDL